jgi:parvulin-like peptidyl-prolyl isomerase
VTRAEIEAYYTPHRSEFERPRTAHARQIVVKTREEALDVLRQLRSGADFGELAAERSIAPEADVGGDLGTVTADDLQPELSEVCFSLPVGQLSREVETPFGFHVIQVLARNPPTTPTLQEVETRISEILQSRKRQAAYERWLADLRAKANIRLAGQ